MFVIKKLVLPRDLHSTFVKFFLPHPCLIFWKASMRELYAISIVCLCALIWAAVSIGRHILATQRRRHAPHQHPLLNEFLFEGKQQQIREHSSAASRPAAVSPGRRPTPATVADGLYTPPARVAPMHASPELAFARKPHRAAVQPSAEAQPQVVMAKKPAQPGHTSRGHHRVYDEFFTNDLGDLSDPYRPNSGKFDRSAPEERNALRDGTSRY